MPGPGGGSRGGGGGRGFGGGHSGGNFGGGPRGGGFGGGPHGGPGGPWGHRPPPRRGFGFGGFWGPRYYGGGGCLGGLMGMLLLPIILILIVVVLLFSTISSAFINVTSGGQIIYDEEKMQDYAMAQYDVEFGSSDAYEDNILLVFATEDKNYSDFAFIALVGNHIETDVNEMFGGNSSDLGRALASTVPENYKYSLSQNFMATIERMQERVEKLQLESNFKDICHDTHADVTSHITNKTETITIDTASVNATLAEFTEATGISVVIVVDEAEDVLGKSLSVGDIITVILCIVMLVFAIVLIVKAVKKKKDGGNGGDDNNGNNYNSNYNNGYNNYNGYRP